MKTAASVLMSVGIMEARIIEPGDQVEVLWPDLEGAPVEAPVGEVEQDGLIRSARAPVLIKLCQQLPPEGLSEPVKVR
jgi:hypothetical protein